MAAPGLGEGVGACVWPGGGGGPDTLIQEEGRQVCQCAGGIGAAAPEHIERPFVLHHLMPISAGDDNPVSEQDGLGIERAKYSGIPHIEPRTALICKNKLYHEEECLSTSISTH